VDLDKLRRLPGGIYDHRGSDYETLSLGLGRQPGGRKRRRKRSLRDRAVSRRRA
jgi:hypothetical protein